MIINITSVCFLSSGLNHLQLHCELLVFKCEVTNNLSAHHMTTSLQADALYGL